MQFLSIKRLIRPLIKSGQEWQYISLNAEVKNKPKLYFSGTQLIILAICIFSIFWLKKGLDSSLMGYIISGFAISVSLFMSLLVNIFDKFEKTAFTTKGKDAEEIVRLDQKRNFFKKFISITSYLVLMSILIIVLCSFSYIHDTSRFIISLNNFCYKPAEIDYEFTLKCIFVFFYRVALNYFLLDYLLLTLFIAGSSYEYYMSELNRTKII